MTKYWGHLIGWDDPGPEPEQITQYNFGTDTSLEQRLSCLILTAINLYKERLLANSSTNQSYNNKLKIECYPFPSKLALNKVYTATTATCIAKLKELKNQGLEIILTKMKLSQASLHANPNAPITDIELPPQTGTYRQKLKSLMITRWSHRWQELGRQEVGACRQTRFWLQLPNKQTSKYLMSLNRLKLGLMIQFITGHGWLRRHQSLVDHLETDPTCRLCIKDDNERPGEETPIHLVTECEIMKDKAKKLFYNDTPQDDHCDATNPELNTDPDLDPDDHHDDHHHDDHEGNKQHENVEVRSHEFNLIPHWPEQLCHLLRQEPLAQLLDQSEDRTNSNVGGT